MKTAIAKRESGIGAGRLAMVLIAGALLGGCSILGGNKTPSTIYAPDPRVQADPAWPAVDWQLTLSPPTAGRMVDSQRIAVRPTPGELQVYKGAVWAKSPSEQVTDTVLHALEDSGKIPAVARQGSGVTADYKLVMDLRRFEADYAGAAVPKSTIEVSAKLLHASDQDIVASHIFLQAVPAASTDVAAVTQAFDQALGMIGRDITGWILSSGDAHEHSGAHAAKRKPN
jgi:cholesterol transport system auxiliary component